MAQAAKNGEHRVKVFTVFAVFGDFDEMLDDFHPLDRVVFRTNLRAHPKHFAIHCGRGENGTMS